MRRRFLTALLLHMAVVTADFTTNCPSECNCLWASGNKAADCSNAHLSDIPRTLSTEIQNLELAGNDLYQIKGQTFKDVGLINLKKLFLRECKLVTIEKDALSGLAIMIELDLSRNDISNLHADTFKETVKIRFILLKDNKLEKLEDGLFNNLPLLQKVDLSNNRIVTLGLKTFMNVPKLNYLRLDGNKLEHLKSDTLSSLTSLSNLDVRDNPWRCDCHLQPFINWTISDNLVTAPISCTEPHKLKGKLWKDLDSDDLTCTPNVVNIANKDFDSKTLSCQVNGNSLPDVNLILNNQVIEGTRRAFVYSITQASAENIKWVNISLVFNNN